MEKRLLMALMMSFMMTIALISCGGDSDDDDDNETPQEETTGTSGTTGTTGSTGTTGTTGSTGTTGTSGTSGTTGSTACLTNNQRENVRTFLNRASDLRTYTGTGLEFVREDDMGVFNRVEGTFDYQQTGENTWVVNSNLCTVAAEPQCETVQTTLRLQNNGCLTVDGTRARVTSSSDSSLSYRYLANGTVSESASLSTGLLRVRQSVRTDGERVYELNFQETAP